MNDQQISADHAQGKLNRAVSRWADNRTQIEGTRVEMELYSALQQYRDAVSRAAVSAPHIPSGVPDDLATEARIANLLAVSEHHRTMGIDGADLIRTEALIQALRLLSLLPQAGVAR